MKINHLFNALLIAGMLTAGAASWAGDGAIRVSSEAGTPVARFSLGDSHCVLKNDRVLCTPASKLAR
ncbi:MAG TPA: hypothetical protein VML56_02245 [Burkholderiales bacterium]|nr:hypothetical protein [Burkholderiales bacterium]